MDIRQLTHGVLDSVIVDDFDRVTLPFMPDEADAPLVVDSDAVLLGALSFS
jgi:hypothetical protein